MPILKPTRGTLLNKSHPLARGLVGCWLLNEGTGGKISDLSGSRNTGTLVADTHFVPGKFGSALDFDGVSDYVNVGSNSVLGFTSEDFTISAWVNTGNIATQQMIFSRGTWRENGYYFQLSSSRLEIATNKSGIDRVTNSISNPFSSNTWVLVTAVRQGSSVKLYINGREVTYNAQGTHSDPDYDAGPAHIGTYSTTSLYEWYGQIDHVMIWNRALSASEIVWLYKEPFCMFERAIRPVLIGGQIINFAGTSAALSSLSATAKAIRKVGGTVAGTSDAAALLNSIRGEESSLDIERSWLREALFNGMTANVFKLGTTLSLGWFWVRVSGCSVLYRGPSMQGIDFTNILTVAEQNACEISPPSYIPHNSGSIYFYVIRRFNNCGYQELTLAAAAKVSINASGDLEKPQPNNIFSSKAEQVNGNKIQLVWFYCPLEQKSQPVCFNVYYNGGMGQIDYENPLAKISYKGRRFYSYQSGALGAGGYLFTIRAEDADGIENSSSAQLKIQLDTTNPDAIDILSTETV